MNKFHFIFDKTTKAQKLKKLLYKYKNYTLKKSNIIIVAGGDGFMIRNIKKYYKLKKPFYGINCGSIGFLMNRYQYSDFLEKVIKSKTFSVNPLEIQIENSICYFKNNKYHY